MGSSAFSGIGSKESLALNAAGDILAVGEINFNAGIGRVTTYSFDTVLSQWIQLAQNIDGSTGDTLGGIISLNDDGDVLAIASSTNSSISNLSGRVKVFEINNNIWSQVGQNLNGDSSGDRFGSTINLNGQGNILAVGAPQNDGNGNLSGQVKVFENINSNWVQVGSDIYGENSSDSFGNAISINDIGTKIVVGSFTSGNSQGKTLVYELFNDSWIKVFQTISGGNDDREGFGVSMNGNGEIIASTALTYDNSNVVNSGRVRLFSVINNPPVISNCPININQNNNNGVCGAQVSWTLPTALDIDGTITSFSSTYNPGDILPVGTTSVVYTAIDNVGAISTCSFDVVVNDNEIPDIVLQDITVDLDSAGQANISTSDISISITDNCSIASNSLDMTAFDCSSLGINTITLSVTDINGNIATSNATVTVEDNIPPFALSQDVTVQLGSNNTASITASDIDNGSADNCSVSSLSLDVTDFDCDDIGQNTVILTVTDGSGNTSTATATVTVDGDPNQPINAIAKDITVQLDANGIISITAQDVDDGSGSGCNSSPTLSLNRTDFNCDDVGQVTVTLTATDGTTTDSDTAVITIEDNIAPSVQTQNITVLLDANGQATITTADIENGSADNCLIASSSLDVTEFDCSTLGNNTVTLTVTDTNGNTGTGTATVTVEDNIAPVALSQDITVQLGSNNTASITASDIDNGSADNCSVSSLSLDVTDFDCDDIGQNTVILTVTDGSGNTSTATATVTVDGDPNQPINAIAKDITVQLDANGIISITAQDVDDGSGSGCNSSPTLSLNRTDFNCDDVGQVTVTLTATDGTTTDSDTAVITIEDNIAPSVQTQNITVLLDANGQATITTADIENGSADNCLIASSSLDVTEFDCSTLGNNTVTLTVTDTNGNTGTGTATVTVEDNIAPVALSQDITVQLGANNTASITASDIDNGSTDNCSVSSLSLDVTDFDCDDIGQNTVILNVTDVSGNTSTATATVTVEGDPNQPINAIAKDITVQLDANGIISITAQDVDDGSGSGCNSSPTLTLNRTNFNCDDIGQVTVTLTATDGNSTDSDTALVTVEDNILPQISCPNNITVAPNNSGLFTLPDYWSLGETLANDNCLVNFSSRSQTPLPGTQLTDGTYTISFGVEDNTGNVGSCDFTLIVDESLSNGDYNLASIDLIPNPVKEQLTITNPNNVQLEYLNIYDLTGRLVKHEVFNLNSAQTTMIEVSTLPSAVYLIELYAQNRIIIKKVVKE